MHIVQFQSFYKLLTYKKPVKGLLLGLDVGTKRIGLSISDPSHKLAFPLTTYERLYLEGRMSSNALNHLTEYMNTITKKHSISGIVVGFPLLSDGTASPLCHEIIHLMQVIECTDSPHLITTMWNENGSTAAARSYYKRFANNNRKEFLNNKDSLAAAFILQSYMNYVHDNLE